MIIKSLKGSPNLGDLQQVFNGCVWVDFFSDKKQLLRVGEKFEVTSAILSLCNSSA